VDDDDTLLLLSTEVSESLRRFLVLLYLFALYVWGLRLSVFFPDLALQFKTNTGH